MSFCGVGGAWTVGYLNIAGAAGRPAFLDLVGDARGAVRRRRSSLPALRLRGISSPSSRCPSPPLSTRSGDHHVLRSDDVPGSTRPALNERRLFVFALLFYVAIAIALEHWRRSRLGASWRSAVRHRARHRRHGVSIAAAKLSSFAISAFIWAYRAVCLRGYLYGTLVAENFS